MARIDLIQSSAVTVMKVKLWGIDLHCFQWHPCINLIDHLTFFSGVFCLLKVLWKMFFCSSIIQKHI